MRSEYAGNQERVSSLHHHVVKCPTSDTPKVGVRLVGGPVPIDVVDALRELGFTFSEGAAVRSWLLRSPDGETYDVELTAPVDRVTAHSIRNVQVRHSSPIRQVFVGRTATDGVRADARSGRIDLLTESPLQLIVHGTVHELETPAFTPRRRTVARRVAWYRWALERLLLISDSPLRQTVIAEVLGTSQQSVSNAARTLGALVVDHGGGLEAADKRALLRRWTEEYSGPGGQEFGWFSLESAVDQVSQAVEVAELLDADPLVSGDVAADRLAPWKLPTRGRVYVKSPIDLSGDGFVPAPVDESTLITCVPRDPTLWRLAAWESPHLAPPVADAALVYWDVLVSGDVDSAEAAERVERLLVKGI